MRCLALAFALWLCGGGLNAATLTLTNANATGTGAHAVTTSSGTLLPATAHVALGRFTLSDAALQSALAANDMAAVEAGWQGLGGSVPINGFNAPGRVDAVVHGDTRPSSTALGGEAVWLWLSDQASRPASTQHLIVRLDGVFPTDSETWPPEGPVVFALRPDPFAKVMVGSISTVTHDFGFGSGPLVTLRLGNAPPSAYDATFQLDEDTVLEAVLTATDANNDPLTFSITSEPSHGNVTLTPGTGAFSYQPAANYHGTDRFSFIVSDGASFSNEAVVSLTILSVPDVPVAMNQSFDVSAGVPLNGQLQAFDGDGDPLVFSVVTWPVKGSLLVNDSGSFTYTSVDGEVGADSFTFKVNDGTFDSNVATVSLEIIPNFAPVAAAAVFETDEGNLLVGTVSASDANNDPLSFSLQTAPNHGTVSMNSNGGFRYRPRVGYLGLDSFTFTASDGDLASSPAAVTIAVQPRTPQWTWLHGPSKPRQKEILTDDEITPTARMDAASAVDSSGRVWMHGGSGAAALSDLWRYDTASDAWTAIPPSDSNPGTRIGAAMWCAHDDTLWLWGGSNTQDELWRYDPNANEWQAQMVAGEKPSPRTHALSWRDATGRFWLFGGKAKKALDDLWFFDPHSGVWTEVSIPVKPAARSRAASWVDKAGYLWLFGGQGVKSALNDLWKFDPLHGKWTQVDSDSPLKRREGAIGWALPDGRFIIVFGSGDDVWRYDPAATEWELVKGRIQPNGTAVHGVKQTPDRRNTPGHRGGSMVLHETASGMRLFGGGRGKTVWSDTWEFHLGLTPTVRLERVQNITANSAEVFVTVDAGGLPLTETTLRCWPSGSPEQAQSTAGTSLSGLLAGTWYDVEATVTSAIGVSRSGLIRFRTAGANLAQPKWASPGPTLVSEGDGQVVLHIDLGTAADTVQQLSFDYSGGSATAPEDIVALPLTLSVPAGQRFAELLLEIVDDKIEEGSESLFISLNGGPPHELIITDNDGPSQIDTPPVSQIIASGTRAAFQVIASGTPPLRYQWKRDGVNLKGANKPALTTNRAGTYTVEVTGALGAPTLSAPADLGVVVVKNESRAILLDSSTSFMLSASGPALSFSWEKDDLPTGQTSARLDLSALQPSGSGRYRCRVTHPQAGDFLGGIITLQVMGAVPELSADPLPQATVGTPYLHQLAILNLPEGAPSVISASGLPAGLKCSRTGLITGIPRAATATPRTVRLQARNLSGPSVAVTTSIEVRPVPLEFQGRYIAVVPGDPALAEGLGGLFEVTTTKRGSFTARLGLGPHRWSGKGPLHVTGEASAELQLGGHQVQFQVTEQELVGSAEGIAFSGRKQSATGGTQAIPFLLELPEETIGDLDLPQGLGFGSLRIAKSGQCVVAGITADGLPFTCASLISNDGWIPLFTANSGSLLGEVSLSAGLADAALVWTRSPARAGVAYRHGFAGQAVTLRGGAMEAIPSGGVLMNLPNQEGNARLEFSEAWLADLEVPPLIFSIRNPKAAGTTQRVQLPPSHPARATFKLGSPFTCGFVLADGRRATGKGLIIQRGTAFEAGGHFLLPLPLEPGQTARTADRLSGLVRLTPSAP